MKKKLMGVLGLCIFLSSCAIQKDTYISKRHPEANEASTQEIEESMEIKYTEGTESLESSETESTQTINTDDVDGVEYEASTNLNIRLAPSTDSGVVVEVPGGSKVIKIGENGDWTRATYEGYTGYILTELLVPVN